MLLFKKTVQLQFTITQHIPGHLVQLQFAITQHIPGHPVQLQVAITQHIPGHSVHLEFAITQLFPGHPVQLQFTITQHIPGHPVQLQFAITQHIPGHPYTLSRNSWASRSAAGHTGITSTAHYIPSVSGCLSVCHTCCLYTPFLVTRSLWTESEFLNTQYGPHSGGWA
jgi:hypothetical protein